MNRAHAIGSLLEQPTLWDVLVIGGGATGLGVAVDAAARGLMPSAQLIESSVFNWGFNGLSRYALMADSVNGDAKGRSARRRPSR